MLYYRGMSVLSDGRVIGMTCLVVVLWALLGGAELRRVLLEGRADERDAAARARRASAVRHSCEAPTMWNGS